MLLKSSQYLSSLTVTALLGGLAFSRPASASEGHLIAAEEVIGDDGYNKTYNDESKSFKDRMKESRETPVIAVENTKGGLFLGVNGMVGPVYDASPKSTSGIGFALNVEPGYTIQTDSWNRFEFGIQVGYNSFSWKVDKATLTIAPMSFMPQVGWGYSFGPNLFGVLKLGGGFATGEMTAKTDNPLNANERITLKYTGSNATLFAGNYDVVYGDGKIQWTGGIGAVHYKYTWSDVSNNGVKSSTDEVTNLNFVNMHGGLRLQF